MYKGSDKLKMYIINHRDQQPKNSNETKQYMNKPIVKIKMNHRNIFNYFRKGRKRL